jgi:hypothetical protein
LILYHYTDARGLQGILASGLLHASTSAQNPSDARYGDGQYLSDVRPGTKTPSQLSRMFLNLPFYGHRFSHYIAIDVSGLSWIECRRGVYLIPNDQALVILERLRDSGVVPQGTSS